MGFPGYRAMPSDSTTVLQNLLNRMNAGEAAARDELIERACARLRRLTRKIFKDYRRVRQFEDSADVLQNVLVRLTRRLQNLTGKTSEQAPPATVAAFFQLAGGEIRHALLDLVRHYFGPAGLGRHQLAPGESPDDSSAPDAAAELSDHTHDPKKLQMWTEFHDQVEALPAEEREVFSLRWYHGLSTEESAEILNLSPATVKRRWVTARLALQAIVDEALLTE